MDFNTPAKPMVESLGYAQIVRVFLWFFRWIMGRFDKPAIDIQEQLELLKQRGLQIHCEQRAALLLRAVSYFRLTPYMRPFQAPGDSTHQFLPNVKLKDLYDLYEFDRRLRLLVIDAIERIEVAVRAVISNHMGPAYGSHWYLKRSLFKNRFAHEKILKTIRDKQAKERADYEKEVKRIESLHTSSPGIKRQLIIKRRQESYARHYALNYSEPTLMPGWAMVEELTFGSLSRLYSGLAKHQDQKAISTVFSLHVPLMASWLHVLTVIRNICAHHGRLWNREFGVQPMLPKDKSIQWPVYLKRQAKHTRVIVGFAIIHYLMLQISPQSRWHKELEMLLEAYPFVPKEPMGLIKGWNEDPFWKLHHS